MGMLRGLPLSLLAVLILLAMLLLATAALLGISTGLTGRTFDQESDAPGIMPVGKTFGGWSGIRSAGRWSSGSFHHGWSFDRGGGRCFSSLRSGTGLASLANGGAFAGDFCGRGL